MIGKALVAAMGAAGALVSRDISESSYDASRGLLQTSTTRIGASSSTQESQRDRAGGSKAKVSPLKTIDFKSLGSSATCSAKATGRGWAKAFDTHTSAMAEATAITCEYDPYEDGTAYLVAVAEAFASDVIAIGEVVAETQAKCESKQGALGQAYGCAIAESQVSRFITIWANTHAGAVAKAVTRCSGCAANVDLKSRLNAGIFTKIIEEITAYSFSSVCVEGTDHREEFKRCATSFIGEQFAYAFAEAFIGTDCHGSAEGEIIAEADAYVELTTTSECDYRPPKYY